MRIFKSLGAGLGTFLLTVFFAWYAGMDFFVRGNGAAILVLFVGLASGIVAFIMTWSMRDPP